jgi:hypothetical protein
MAKSHGGNSWSATTFSGRTHAKAEQAPESMSPSDIDMFGYSNFLTSPESWQRSGHRNTEASLALLRRLASVLHTGRPVTLAEENPSIPAGYTYLLQLLAHDCVHTPTPFWQISGGRIAARNGRIARLRLDTLYGLGPFGTPHAYAPDDALDTTRSAFRLGPMKPDVAKPALRDIARIGCPADGLRPMLTDPLICDPRNEDNAILAQMTALWHMIHNAFLQVAPRSGGEAARERRFTWARAATTSAYRRVLRDDLMPRLLHPAVFARYRAGMDEGGLLNRRPEAYARPKASVPLEFSHGAMRFAHTIIRPAYRINNHESLRIEDALSATSARRPASMPLDASWIIRWGHFFDGVTDGQVAVNRSLLIRPRYVAAFQSPHDFPGPAPHHGLAMHDLASAAAAPMWSVPELHAKITERAVMRGWAEPFDEPTLARSSPREAAVAAWLERRENPSEKYRIFQPGDIDSLAKDPPLPFYIQFEAEHVHGGRRLGPLGSILVAEVVFGALMADPLPGEPMGAAPAAALPTALGTLARALGMDFGQDVEMRFPAEGTMAALIRFVAREHGLEAASPAFL